MLRLLFVLDACQGDDRKKKKKKKKKDKKDKDKKGRKAKDEAFEACRNSHMGSPKDGATVFSAYPLVNWYITMENHNF